jgi:hypothetical protein
MLVHCVVHQKGLFGPALQTSMHLVSPPPLLSIAYRSCDSSYHLHISSLQLGDETQGEWWPMIRAIKVKGCWEVIGDPTPDQVLVCMRFEPRSNDSNTLLKNHRSTWWGTTMDGTNRTLLWQWVLLLIMLESSISFAGCNVDGSLLPQHLEPPLVGTRTRHFGRKSHFKYFREIIRR